MAPEVPDVTMTDIPSREGRRGLGSSRHAPVEAGPAIATNTAPLGTRRRPKGPQHDESFKKTSQWQKLLTAVNENKSKATIIAALRAALTVCNENAPKIHEPPNTDEIRKVFREELARALPTTTTDSSTSNRTWASVAASKPVEPPTRRHSTTAPKVVPQRHLRQILIKRKNIAPEFANRNSQDTVTAVNLLGRKGDCLAANKLRSGDILLTFHDKTQE